MFDREEYDKKYRQEHKEEIRMRERVYRQKLKVKVKKKTYMEQWRTEHPNYAQKWIDRNRERCRGYCKKYRETHKEKRKAYKKAYDQRPRVKVMKKTWENRYVTRRRHADEKFLVMTRLRHSLYLALDNYTKTGKISKARDYGINYEAIIRHLGKKPEGDYEIDHIKPLCSFDLTDNGQVREAFKPENLRWLITEENHAKIKEDKKQSIHLSKVEVR